MSRIRTSCDGDATHRYFLVVVSIEDPRGRDRGRELQKNKKNLLVNQFPQGPQYKREEEGGGNDPAKEGGGNHAR